MTILWLEERSEKAIESALRTTFLQTTQPDYIQCYLLIEDRKRLFQP